MAFDPQKLEAARKVVVEAKTATEPTTTPTTAPTGGFDPAKLDAARTTLPGAYEGGENFDFAGSAKKTAGHVWNKYIAPEVIPTLASLAATKSPALTIAGRVGMLAAPAFETALQGGANYLGEKANQALGITPPDESNAVIRGVTAGGTAGVGKGLGMVRPFMGRTGAVTANDLATTEASRMVNSLTPRQNSESLFNAAMASGAKVPMPNTVGVLSSLIGRPKNGQSLSWAYGPAAQEIKAIQQEFRSGTTLSPARWQFLHTRLGQAVGKMTKDGGKGSGEAKELYKAMMDDLEQAANKQMTPQNTGIVTGGTGPIGPNQGGPDLAAAHMQAPSQGIQPPIAGQLTGPQPAGQVPSIQPTGTLAPVPPSPSAPRVAPTTTQPTPSGNTGASTLLAALNTYRREKSVERLSKYVENATKNLKGQGEDTQFNAKTVIDSLKKDKFYEKSFTNAEQRDIESTLHVLNKAPNLPLHSSVNAGSKRVFERMAAAGTAGALVAATSGPLEGAVAATGGLLLRDAADFHQNLAFALQTKSGRELIKELAKTKGGIFTPRNLATLTGYVSAVRDQPDSEMAQ